MKMKRIITVTAISLVLIFLSSAFYFRPEYIEKESEKFRTLREKNKTTAFKNVNVITMHSDKVLHNQTVVVEGGIIKYIGNSSEVKILGDAVIIDGQGKYLMPGLTDMHTHILMSKNDLLLYIANGVTSVRNMAGIKEFTLNPVMNIKNHIDLKNKIKEGRLLGPTIYTAGQILESEDGPSFVTPLYIKADTAEEAVKAVEITKSKGFEFVKVYNKMPLKAFEAALSKAGEYRLRVIGHVPHAADLKEVISKKQLHTIEHLSGYTNPFDGFKIPANSIDEYARLTAKMGIWNCPTIVVWQNLVPESQLEDSNKLPFMKYTSESARKVWESNIKTFNKYVKDKKEGFNKMPSEHIEDFFHMTFKLHESGAPLLLGTDSGTLNVVPGFSIHQELRNLVKSGLTPYEAIKTGTYNAALCMDKLDEYGTIEVNKRADLMLLNANPLDNVENLEKRAGVMVNGLWIEQSMLDSMLEDLAKE